MERVEKLTQSDNKKQRWKNIEKWADSPGKETLLIKRRRVVDFIGVHCREN